MVGSAGRAPLSCVRTPGRTVTSPTTCGVAGPALAPVHGPGVAVRRLDVPLFPPPPPTPPPALAQQFVPLVPFSPSGEHATSAPPQMAGLSMYRTLGSDGYSDVARQKGLYRSIEDETLQPQEHLERALALRLADGPSSVCVPAVVDQAITAYTSSSLE